MNGTAITKPLDSDQPLRAFTNDCDTWVGHSVADVLAMCFANYGTCESEEGEWEEVPGDKTLTISDEGHEPFITKTVAEWIAQEGRGLLCSTEF